jgi:hypothetical protein
MATSQQNYPENYNYMETETQGRRDGRPYSLNKRTNEREENKKNGTKTEKKRGSLNAVLRTSCSSS